MALNEKAVAELKATITEFSNFEMENLISRDEWGSISLEKARSDFARIFEIVKCLQNLPIESLPVTPANQIRTQQTSIIEWFKKIDAFSVETDNPANQRKEFISNIASQAEQLYTVTAP